MRGVGSVILMLTAVAMPVSASAQGAPGGGTPANICKELATFIRPPAAPAPAPTPAGQTAAVQAPNQSGPTAQPPAGGDPQKTSGLSAPVANGGPGASGPQGASQNANAPSGAAPAPAQQAAASPAPAAPAAPAAPPPKKPSPEDMQRADAAIGSNDIAACQASARGMRRAGVVMPAPLMSLAALDLKFLVTAADAPK